MRYLLTENPEKKVCEGVYTPSHTFFSGNGYVWSPNGIRIAFQSDRDGNWEIYVMDSDGGNPTNLTQSPANDTLPFWRP